MPFEAAHHDRPCLFASRTALAEILPHELGTLVPWDPHASAERVNDLLTRPEAIAAQVRAIRRTAGRLTWQSTGESIVDVYRAAAVAPARETARLAEELALVEAERDETERKYNELWEGLTPDALTLAAPGGPLSPEAQRSLSAVAHRPVLRRLLLGPAHLAHRLATHARGRSADARAPSTPPEILALHFAEDNVHHMAEQLNEADTDGLIPEP